jgi:hypothetical protein
MKAGGGEQSAVPRSGGRLPREYEALSLEDEVIRQERGYLETLPPWVVFVLGVIAGAALFGAGMATQLLR